MTITQYNLEQEKQGDRLQLLLVGAEKSGKSELASTAPDPVLFLEHDQRATSLAGKHGVFALSYRDPANTSNQPTAFNEMLQTLSQLEASLDLAKLGFKVPVGTDVKTLVFDSISTIANACRRYTLYCNPKDLAYTVSVGGQTYRTPRNWTAWGAEMEMVEGAILRAMALPVNVIITLHEAQEESEDSTQEVPKFTGKITVFPTRYRLLLKYFNEVWRLTRTASGPPQISFNPDGMFTKASSALRIQSTNVADIKQILRSATGNGASQWTPTASPSPKPAAAVQTQSTINNAQPLTLQQMMQQRQKGA